MRKMKCSELVLDFDLYPRSDVDSQHVAYIAQAMAAGTEMPPVVICKKTKRVADGFHRIRAAQRLFKEKAEVEVVEKNYRNDRELFLDAMRYNSSHGRTLTTYDRAHCAIRAANLGIDDSEVAGVLHVSADYIGSLRVDRSAVSGGLHVPIKRTIAHMAGKKLSKEQTAANNKLSGMQPAFYANQLSTLIESKLIDLGNEKVMESLKRLHELLEGMLVSA